MRAAAGGKLWRREIHEKLIDFRRAQERVGQTRRLQDRQFDEREFSCSHYVEFREREIDKNTSRKMHTPWSVDA